MNNDQMTPARFNARDAARQEAERLNEAGRQKREAQKARAITRGQERRAAQLERLRAELDHADTMVEGYLRLRDVARFHGMEYETERMAAGIEEYNRERADVMARGAAAGFTPEDFYGPRPEAYPAPSGHVIGRGHVQVVDGPQ